MSILKKHLLHRAQRRIALEIAERHGLTTQYKAILKNGKCPLEALEDLSAVTENERKLFYEMEKIKREEGDCEKMPKEKERKKFDLLFNRANVIASILAVVLSGFAIIFSYQATMRINSKEYEISESLKYELLKIIADLKSIDAKAAIAPLLKDDIDFSDEVESIANLRTSPGFLLYLQSIENEKDRFWLDYSMLYLTSRINSMNENNIRSFTHRILEVLKNGINLNNSMNMKAEDVMEGLCNMRIVAPEHQMGDPEKDVWIKYFLTYLVVNKKINNPDVLFLYRDYCEDSYSEEFAINNKDSNIRITVSEIIHRYQEEYNEFILTEKKNLDNMIMFMDFLQYLVYEKNDNNPDVSLLFGISVGNEYLIKRALDAGANPFISDTVLIERYRAEFDMFCKSMKEMYESE